MDSNPFLKRIMKPAKEDIFHSSAYGKAQNGASMGAAATGSFSERMKVEQGRTMVKGYGSSSIAGSGIGNGPRAKAYVPPASGNSNSGPKPGVRPTPPRNPGISR